MKTDHSFSVKIKVESAEPPTRDQEEALLDSLRRGLEGHNIVGLTLLHYKIRIPGTARVSSCSFDHGAPV